MSSFCLPDYQAKTTRQWSICQLGHKRGKNKKVGLSYSCNILGQKKDEGQKQKWFSCIFHDVIIVSADKFAKKMG